jgi:hypothetical protein
MEKIDLSQVTLPYIPCAATFLVSDLFHTQTWIVTEFNRLRNTETLFERVLSVGLLTHLSRPKPGVDLPKAVIELETGIGPNHLAVMWLKEVFAENEKTEEALEFEWLYQAAKLSNDFDTLTALVCEENDQDKLWAAGVKLLHARDDLQRVGNLIRTASEKADYWTKLFNSLDTRCAIHHSVWSMIEPREDKRIHAAMTDNVITSNTPWWHEMVCECSTKNNLEYCEATDPTLYVDESGVHFWLGMFTPDMKLRDNFLMYIGENEDMNRDNLANALQSMGEIHHEHLTHSGCQILFTHGDDKIWSFASVQPFHVGDQFSLVGGDEHQQLVGEGEHFTELRTILRLIAVAKVEAQDAKRKLIHMEEQVFQMETLRDIQIIPPAIDMLVDLKTAPEWIKEYVYSAFESRSPYQVAVSVGLMARTNQDEIRERAKLWAKSLTKEQCYQLTHECTNNLVELAEAAALLESESNPITRADMASHILHGRDGIESCIWVLEAIGRPISFTTENVDSRLLDCKPLFEAKIDPDTNRFNKTLMLVRETCPACWWVARANFI